MNTPTELWEKYREMVFEGDLTDQQDFECKRAFFAGSEAVFKLLEDCTKSNLRPSQTFQSINTYRNLNRAAAMETIPDDEQEETLE